MSPDKEHVRSAGHRPAQRVVGLVVGAVTATLLGGSTTSSAQAAPVPGLSSYQVSVDVDGDGRVDTVTLSTPPSGRRTLIELQRDSGPPVRHSLPFRGAAHSLTTGERLEGVTPLTRADAGDLVVLSSTGTCNGYRILRWTATGFSTVPNPAGGREWRVCGLGVAPRGLGFTSSHGRNGPKVVALAGRQRDANVRVRRTVYHWERGRWSQTRRSATMMRAVAALPLWGLDFPWRST